MSQTPDDRPLTPAEVARPEASAVAARRAVVRREINTRLQLGHRRIDLEYATGYLWSCHRRDVRAVLEEYSAAGWSVDLDALSGRATFEPARGR